MSSFGAIIYFKGKRYSVCKNDKVEKVKRGETYSNSYRRDGYTPQGNPEFFQAQGSSPSRFHLTWWNIVFFVLLVCLVALLLFLVFIGHPYVVRGYSMLPTLEDGDRLIVVPYRKGMTPDRGDVVILEGVKGIDEMLIKRVIAISGDKITVKNGRIIVNDRDVFLSAVPSAPEEKTFLIPSDHVFVMGDNEDHSYDSRTFGPIPLSKIKGKALFVFWPVGNAKTL
ncbi:MAG: signal peptidase I [Actinomycetota bacterium]|nr:signal peptidase I [Actinomycetota bacterium]